MLTILTWKWDRPGYRSTFTGAHVNALARMVAKHYPAPHRVLCVTNNAKGIDPAITVVPDMAHYEDLPSPHGAQHPTCYRRLLAFHPDAAEWFGERFVSIDIDTVITGDMRPVWDRDEDFVGYRDPYYGSRGQYCGAMFLLRAGSRPKVWTDFNPKTSRALAAHAGFRGSDQAWISYCLRGAPAWSTADGVYSYRVDIVKGNRPLPSDARMVVFHGEHDPWDALPQKRDWVREHWGTNA